MLSLAKSGADPCNPGTQVSRQRRSDQHEKICAQVGRIPMQGALLAYFKVLLEWEAEARVDIESERSGGDIGQGGTQGVSRFGADDGGIR